MKLSGKVMKNSLLLLILISWMLQPLSVSAAVNHKPQMLNWEEVNSLLPKYSKFTVMDLETGKKFNVQRRAGSNHADVQPLTPKDTKIMKAIYGGQWSWKRRAIIVIDKQLKLAASMHGMPHGAGALANDFPGHFCIHFYGSTTHRTNFMDVSHKLMILKAAGKLESYLSTTDPYEVITAFITGFKQSDENIISTVSLQKSDWGNLFQIVENAKITNMPILPVEDLKEELSMDVPIEVEWYIKGRGRVLKTTEIHLIRFSQQDPWKIDARSFVYDQLGTK